MEALIITLLIIAFIGGIAAVIMLIQLERMWDNKCRCGGRYTELPDGKKFCTNCKNIK